MSAANGERMLARQNQIASDLAYYVDRGFAKSREEMTTMCNMTLYNLAQSRGISLWDLCFSVVPRWKPTESSVNASDPHGMTLNAEYQLELVPLEIDFEHGPDYWEMKYRRLKLKMKELIDEEKEK